MPLLLVSEISFQPSENLQTTYMMLIQHRNDISRRFNPQLEKFVIIAQLSNGKNAVIVIIH